MTPRPRPYRPKTKGCYECSQRRVSCDRATPKCAKCVSKGLECSGLDRRYRFTEGVAIRGKWAGEPVQSLYQRLTEKPRHSPLNPHAATELSIISNHPDCYNVSQVAVSPGRTHKKQRINGCRNGSPWEHHNETFQADLFADGGTYLLYHGCGDEEFPLPHAHSFSSQAHHASNSILIESMNRLVHEPSPDNLPGWQRRLLSHYSDHIAVEMIAIDGPHNGWRHIVLPIAHAHPLVMNAVLAVSAFHVSLQQEQKQLANSGLYLPRKPLPSGRISAEILYDLTIQGLKQRRDLSKSDPDTKQSILVTILVLLAAVMVNGRTDFPILFGMLDAAIEVVGGEDQLAGSELGEFIIRQVRKIRVYAAPLISEHSGFTILSSPSHWEQLFGCLRHCSQTQSDHPAILDRIEDLVRQAHNIYLRQALHDSTLYETETATRESIYRLEHFKNTLEAFPTGSPGKQVLVWATFIAASDCILEEHKAFFEKALIESYNRSKFVNVLEGLAQLRHIWAQRNEGIRWTHLLPQGQLLVM